MISTICFLLQNASVKTPCRSKNKLFSSSCFFVVQISKVFARPFKFTYFNPSTCKVPETQKSRYAYSKSPGKTFDIRTSTTRRKIVGAKFSSTNQVKKDIYVLWQWRMKKNNLFVCFAPPLFKTGFFFSDLGSFSCNKLDYAFALLLRVGPQVNSVMKWKCTFH